MAFERNLCTILKRLHPLGQPMIGGSQEVETSTFQVFRVGYEDTIGVRFNEQAMGLTKGGEEGKTTEYSWRGKLGERWEGEHVE